MISMYVYFCVAFTCIYEYVWACIDKCVACELVCMYADMFPLKWMCNNFPTYSLSYIVETSPLSCHLELSISARLVV